jgi:hypothetical protein
MQRHEYKVISAPAQGEKARGARTTEDRMALALTSAINAEARQGWEYVRSETLPTEERSGLTKRRTVYVNMLVFRRLVTEAEPAAAPAKTPPLSLRALTGFGRAETSREGAPPVAPVLPDTGTSDVPRLGPATAGEPGRG